MTLTNPSSQTKQFTPAEFYSYCLIVEKNKQFQEWVRRQHEPVRISDGGGMALNTDKVCTYLLELGYKIEGELKQGPRN